MSNISWRELFPSKFSMIIFVVYILLFVNQGILVTASQKSDNNYDYNIITVVLMTEVLKLLISSALYCREHSPLELVTEVAKNKNILVLYLIPALLYCFYNNLAFLNLSNFDPTTYYLLLQLRVVVTGILFQVIFSKSLSRKQWMSLLILTVGCMLKQLNFSAFQNQATTTADYSDSQKIQKHMSVSFSINTIFILIQIFCSCFAGVFNESLLKKQGADVNIFVQNVFMYFDSIICNIILLFFNGSLYEAFEYNNFVKIFHYKVLVVMLNNAMVGIITSFFLKTLNSILKTFASALELVLTALLSFLFFGIPIHLNTVLAITVVMYAIYLYSQNPVSNVPKNQNLIVKETKEPLIQQEV